MIFWGRTAKGTFSRTIYETCIAHCAGHQSKLLKSSLKKNNNELAKSLNKCKLVIGRSTFINIHAPSPEKAHHFAKMNLFFLCVDQENGKDRHQWKCCLKKMTTTSCASCSFFVDLLRLLLIFRRTFAPLAHFRNKKLKTVSQHYVESKNNCVEFPSFISTFWDETEMLACSTAGLQEELHTRDEELLSLQQEYRCTVSACPINIHVTILPPVFRIRKIF
jgi:hypothetical protein